MDMAWYNVKTRNKNALTRLKHGVLKASSLHYPLTFLNLLQINGFLKLLSTRPFKTFYKYYNKIFPQLWNICQKYF
jgi:hypothetical protein